MSGQPPHFFTPAYLMCAPQFFDVEYVLNPWMAGNLHRASRDGAFGQWRRLVSVLQRHAEVRMLQAEPRVPDMTFVGHAAVVQHGLAAVSSFAHPERRPEEGYLRRWLEDSGFLVWDTPRETPFEGEGDAIFDEAGKRLWMAFGSRTSAQSHAHVAAAWHVPVHSLHLIDPRFYHLDTCFAPLSGGELLWYPEAFDEASVRLIERSYTRERLLPVSEQDATEFACNVINIGNTIVTGRMSGSLKVRLERLGYEVEEVDLSEFVRGGGSAKSLALRLSDTTCAVRRSVV